MEVINRALKSPQPLGSNCPEWLQPLSPDPVQLQKNVDIDYDRLVCNVEHSIMADRDRAMADITPQELLMRSNPGVFSGEKELSRDLTNPREMYKILAYKEKNNEDLAARFKQELSKSLNSPGLLPKLARTVSMNEIKRNPNQFERLGNKPFQSGPGHSAADKAVDVFVLTRHRTCIGDVRKVREEKENLNSFNLPTITQNAVSGVARNELDYEGTGQERMDLPGLPDGRVKIHEGVGRNKSVLKRKLSTSDTKLDKWFSEMPNEVFDKAQRALMEESIKDKLHRYQEDRGRKIPMADQPPHVGTGSRLRRLPNTFIEVHVDSFGKHLQNDKDEKMKRYTLQQKSMLKLKMRDLDMLERREKTFDDFDLSARLALQPRSQTTLTLSKTKHQPQNVENMQPEVIKITEKNGLKTVNINETVGFDSDAKYNSKYSAIDNKCKTDGPGDGETTADFVPASPPPNSVVQRHDFDESIEKETTKASVVTLSLQKEVPEKRKPFHIEKTIMSVEEKGTHVYSKLEAIWTHDKQTTVDEVDGYRDISQTENGGNHDKVVTKIPTARSNRTIDSKSSSSTLLSGSRGDKSVLKRFNKLEVFAESKRQPEPKMLRKNYLGQKVRDVKEIKDPLPPSVKLDLKHVPHQPRPLIKENGDIARSEVRRQDVVFRFEPGEVFITTRKTNTTSHAYNNRSSERARIIYGKAMHGKDEKREAFLRSLEGRYSSYTSRTSRRENRGTDCYNAHSARAGEGELDNALIKLSRNKLKEEHSAKAKSPHMNNNGVFVRDIAIETDVIGSEPNTPRDTLKPPDAPNVNTARTGSGLSDFIMDNNDGESLDSDEDGDDGSQ